MAAMLAAQPVVALAAPVAAQAQQEAPKQEQPADDAETPKADGSTEAPADEKKAGETEQPSASEEKAGESDKVAPAAKAAAKKAIVSDASNEDSLQAKIDNAKEGAIVKLSADVTENVTVPVGKTITLDLNGHTLSGGTVAKKAALTNNGTVIIKDSSGKNEGKIIREDNGAGGYYTINNQGTMTIESGTVYNQTGPMPNGSSLIINADGDKAATLNIKGGNIKQDGFIAVKNGDHGTLNITGGTIETTGDRVEGNTAYNASAVQNWCTANITGGVIKGAVWTSTWKKDFPASKTTIDGTAAVTGKIIVKQYVDKNGNTAGVIPELNIKGGALNVIGWGVETGSQQGKVTISGGIFVGDNAEGAKKYLVDGLRLDGNGEVVPSAGATVATGSDNQEFTSVQAAIDAASAGSTVKLTNNVDISAPIVVTKKVTLDLDGHTISNSKDIWNEKVSPKLLSLITVRDGGDLTLTGDGTLQAKENDCYAIMLEAESAKLTVENGTYIGNVSSVYVVKGAANLEGGTYKLLQKNTNKHEKPYDPQRYLINCFDANFTAGAAKVSISGGTYEGFDPTKSPEKDAPSFLVPGTQANKDADGNFTVSEAKVAQVGDKTYGTLAKAVATASEGDTVKLLAPSTEKVEVNKPLHFVGTEGVDFKGDLIFQAGAKGSTVKDMSFVIDADSEAEGLAASIHVLGTSDITIEDSTFSIPSRLWGVYGDGGYSDGKSWQPNSIYIGQSSDVTVKGNTFTLGRTNEKTNDSQNPIESDATVAVNIAGQNVSNITLDDNTMTVTKPATDATKDSSVSFLIANGNENNDSTEFGIKGLTVTGNAMTGISGQFNRFAGLSDVDGLTVTGNTLTNLEYGIGRSSWQGKNDVLTNVSVSGNTYNNIYNTPISTEKDAFEASGALVLGKGTNTMHDYATFADAVANANEGDTVFLLGENAENVTIDKQVKVTSVGGAATYTGTMTVTAGATILGLHFEKDTNSIVLKPGTDGAQIMGNTFDVTYNEAVTQANAIYAIDGGVKNLIVVNNTFNAAGVSTVGLNIQNKGVENISLKKNTLNDNYGNAGLVNAFGKGMDNGGTEWGIKTLVVTDNTVNGKYVDNRDGQDAQQRTTCVTIRNVQGVTFENNTLNNVYIGLSYAEWDGYNPSMSTGIAVNKNTATDSLVLSYLLPETTDKDVKYGTGENANVVKQAGYQKVAPVTSTASGMAFAGWYADKELTAPATDESAPAYAKWVPISDVVTFMGNSFRVDNAADYSNVDMRFGYALKSTDGIRSIDSWSWEAGYNGNKVWDVSGTNSRKPTEQEIAKGVDKDATVSNLVVEKIPLPQYGEKEFFAKVKVVYTTADGTKTSLTDSSRTRTVKDLAQTISDKSQDSTEREVARGILNKLGVTDNE